MSEDLKHYSSLSVSDRIHLDRALRGGASRRDVIKMLMAAGMTAAIGGTVSLGASKALADTPKKGGRLKVATYASSNADTLDPARAVFNIDYLRANTTYNGLTRLDDTLTPQMELAEAITSDDAKRWNVKLRKNVEFHDGSKLTADDVIFSLKRHQDPAVASSVKAIADQFQSFDKINDNELVVELTDANADFPTLMGTTGFLILKNGTTNFMKPVGTGPFTVDEFQPGIRSVHSANKNYWRERSGPYLDQIEYFAIQDETARVNALLAGDVDVIANVNPRAAGTITANPAFKILQTVAGQYTNMIMRLDVDPGSNAKFVQAMKHLLNRELIKKAVFRGYAQIGNDQPISPTNRFYRDDIAPVQYDPERAKSLLSEAGLLNAKIPVVASTAASQSEEIAMVLQQAASEIGLTLDVQRVPSDGYWSNYWLKAPICFGNINPRPTPDATFSLLYKSDAPWNESHWKNEKFDSMLLEARGLLDDDKRKEIYGELQKLISVEAGTAIPAFIDGLDAHRSSVKGILPMPTGNLMGNAFAEYVWLDA
jgi:peptide/nickel transport system substrate-binding protein